MSNHMVMAISPSRGPDGQLRPNGGIADAAATGAAAPCTVSVIFPSIGCSIYPDSSRGQFVMLCQ